METITANTEKGKAKKVVLFSLGTLALGTLTFFGIKLYKNHKQKTEDDTDTENTDYMDSKAPVRTPAASKPRTRIPAAHAGSAFPLRLRSKGDTVKQLQLALINRYGAGILPKFGADGDFGSELEAALKAKGFTVPLTEADYNKITQEKQSAPAPAPLVAFDSAAVAKALFTSISTRDFNSSITLLKAIKDTSNYALVSEKLKEYYINGVRQTLVNAMLNNFTESSQRAKVQDTLKSIGLKYNGSQWSLSGLSGVKQVWLITKTECTAYRDGLPFKIPAQTKVGPKLKTKGKWTYFKLFNTELILRLPSNCLAEIL